MVYTANWVIIYYIPTTLYRNLKNPLKKNVSNSLGTPGTIPPEVLGANTGSVGRDVGDVGRGGRGGRGGREGRGGRGGHGGREGREGWSRDVRDVRDVGDVVSGRAGRCSTL